GQRRFRGNGNEGVEAGIESLDAIETRLRELHRGDLPVPHELRGLSQAEGRGSGRGGPRCRALRQDATRRAGQSTLDENPARHRLNSHGGSRARTTDETTLLRASQQNLACSELRDPRIKR